MDFNISTIVWSTYLRSVASSLSATLLLQQHFPNIAEISFFFFLLLYVEWCDCVFHIVFGIVIVMLLLLIPLIFQSLNNKAPRTQRTNKPDVSYSTTYIPRVSKPLHSQKNCFFVFSAIKKKKKPRFYRICSQFLMALIVCNFV